MKYCLWLFVTGLAAFFSIGLHAGEQKVRLAFIIRQNPEVYEESIYGEPPQLAVWIENPDNGQIKTVYVTRKAGIGQFEGKMGVPVALPAWIIAFRQETGRRDFPTPSKPVHDAVSGATLKGELISKEVVVAEGTRWNYYIEVNVAGDFNVRFPNYQPNGEMDPYGNGQPSLVYKGQITARPGQASKPVLSGRTEQQLFTGKINPEVEGITSAAGLLAEIRVVCQKI